MPLRDDQWNDFLKATIRITLTASSRRSIVIDVAGTDADNDPWADFLAIHGKNEFIKEITTHLRRVEDRRRIILFLTAILSYTHNDGDKETIGSLIKLVETGIGSTSRPIAKEPRSFPTPAEPIAMPESDEKPIDYIDFEIHLDAYEIQGEKKVSAKLDCRDSTGKEIVSLAGPCYLNSLADSLSFNPTSETRQPEVVGYGHQIYSKIFSSDLGEKLGEVLGEKPDLIRIGISSTGTKVPNHLWELICRQSNAETFLSLDSKYSVARIVKNDSPSDLRRLEGPIKMLIGHASPTGTDRIPEEHANRFVQIAKSNGHDAEPLPALNFGSIQNLFDKVQGKQFHVVHLICHGKILYDSRGVLVFQDDQGRRQNIEPSVLAQVLKRVSPSLVILQACHSGDMDSSTDFVSGVAETLVRLGIPAVLAFRGKPNIDFAFEFLSKVYEKWLPGQVPIEAAIQSARLAIRNSQTTSLVARPIDAWSLPVLYRQPGVFLQIQHKKSIALNQKNRILVAKLIRELLEECPEVLDVFFLAVKAIELQGANNTKIDAVVNALVPINQSRRHEHETPLYVFRKIATYWVDHSQKIELADHQDRVRVIRDLLYTISFPEDEAERMIEVISNALVSTRSESAGPARAPRSIAPYQLGVKLLQTARALILEQQNNGGVRSSPLYKLLNEQLDKTDTSVFFESKYYKTTLLRVDAKKYATKARPVDKLAEISLQELVGKIVIKNKDFIYRFELELEKAFDMNQMYFLIVPDSFPGVAEEISVAFTRLVVIKEQTGFDSNYHSSLITDYEKIKECLEKVFSTSFS